MNIYNNLSGQINKGRSPSLQYFAFDKDNILEQYSIGYADVAAQRHVAVNDVYNLYSVTKTFTAVAILQLAESGLLNISHPVKGYLPELPYPDNISIRQLLTHSAGIPNPIPLSWIHLASEHGNFNRQAFFRNIYSKYNKTRSAPDSKFAYSNLGYVILGDLIEAVSGISYEEFVRVNILQKLGLSPAELDFTFQPGAERVKGYHDRFSLSYLVLGFFLDKNRYMDKPEGKWRPFREMYVNGPSYGGLTGSPLGLVRFIMELLRPGNVLLNSESMKSMFSENILISGRKSGMCLSWFKGMLDGNVFYTHAGGGGGYYIEMRIYPEKGKGSVIVFNRTGMSDERFLDRIDRELIS